MATNPLEEEAPPTRAEQLASIFGKTKTAVTGSSSIPTGVFVLFVAAVFLASIGYVLPVGWDRPALVVVLLMLALRWPERSRR